MRSNPAPGWGSLAAAVLLMTAMGAVAIVFLYSCARQSQMETQVRQTSLRVEQLRAAQQTWCALIGQKRDPAALRQWARGQGMVFAPEHVDEVRLSKALPPAQLVVSPTASVLPAGGVGPIRAPADVLARLPESSPGH